METKETCSEDSSAVKTSEDTKQKTVTIPVPEDTKTCTKDSCDNNDESKNVKKDQPEEGTPVKDGESNKETTEDSNTRGSERRRFFMCFSGLK